MPTLNNIKFKTGEDQLIYDAGKKVRPLTTEDLVRAPQAEEGCIKRLLETKQGKVKINKVNRNKEPRKVTLMLKEVDNLEVDQ